MNQKPSNAFIAASWIVLGVGMMALLLAFGKLNNRPLQSRDDRVAKKLALAHPVIQSAAKDLINQTE